jgi:hypothetical protein
LPCSRPADNASAAIRPAFVGELCRDPQAARLPVVNIGTAISPVAGRDLSGSGTSLRARPWSAVTNHYEGPLGGCGTVVVAVAFIGGDQGMGAYAKLAGGQLALHLTDARVIVQTVAVPELTMTVPTGLPLS